MTTLARIEFLFTDLCPDIERMIIKNIEYKTNMTRVIRELSGAAESTEYEFQDTPAEYPMYNERFETFIHILDIPFNYMVNEAIFEEDAVYYNDQ